MATRASDFLFKLGEGKELEVIFKKRGPLDFSKCVQMPSNKEVIERYFTIKNDLPQHEPTVSTSLNALSDQLCTEWVHMNIPSVQSKNVRKHHVEPLLQKLKKLQKTAKAKRKDKWHTDLDNFVSNLDNGFDIIAKDEEAKDWMIVEFGIEFGQEEQELYDDNCVPDDSGKCPRKRWVGGVDKLWKKELEEDQEFQEWRENRKEIKKANIEKDREALKAHKSGVFND